MKMMVEVNVFVMPRHFDRFGDLTGSVMEYVMSTRNHLSEACKTRQRHRSPANLQHISSWSDIEC
jgi:hypothetical protein